MFCKHCGMEIDADSSFCPNCGKGLSSEGNVATTSYIQNEVIENQGGMCCPQCGHGNLQVITETNTQTVGKNFSVGQGCLGYLLLGPLGILCGACGQGQHTTTTNATYWVCPKCGKKFRDLEEQRNVIKNTRVAMYSMLLCLVGIHAIAVSLTSVFPWDNGAVWTVFWCGLLLCAVIGIVVYIGTTISIENMEEEIEKIEEAMYNSKKDKESVWKCAQCGRINQNYTGTCACGQKKH